jgi:microsomal dipeptidase-like Zn-dependent dipeptidase
MWMDWIRRAYDGGLRVLVALAVNNKTLGDMTAGPGDYSTDDKSSAARQIGEIKGFISRHPDFMEMAYSSADLQRIVRSNKLAVVLGIEVDKIGNLNPGDPTSAISNEVQRLFNEGVRYIFPIHIIDNAFGGTAVYEDLFNYSNYRETGHWWKLVCDQPADPQDKVTYKFQSQGFDLFRIAGVAAKIGLDFALRNPPDYPNCAQRNQASLTDQGVFAIRDMMKHGMLIDIDHMSQSSFDQALSIAESIDGRYPLFSGHSNIRVNGGSERNPTKKQYERIRNIHGMAGVGNQRLSAKDWVDKYLKTLQAMGENDGAGFGTDTNGLALGMPAGGPQITYGNSFQPSRLGGHAWNYNTDGVAHYGMIIDFLHAVRELPFGADLIDNNLMYGAEYFYETWKLAEEQSAKVK